MSVARAGFAIVLVTFLMVLTGCDRSDCESSHAGASAPAGGGAGAVAVDAAKLEQTPTWKPEDMQTYLHGSISTEFLPERVFEAFKYGDLFPERFKSFGAIVDDYWLPVGFSRRSVPHLGQLTSLGINCAACHTAEFHGPKGDTVRVLGADGNFDVESFFGAVAVATYRTAELDYMKRFLYWYFRAENPKPGELSDKLAALLVKQNDAIAAAVAADPTGAKGIEPGALHSLKAGDLELNAAMIERGADLTPLVANLLKLFHNMRVALHIPDVPPKEPLPPPSGPGRNDPWGVLSFALFGIKADYAPVKFGLVWNLQQRQWVHWDGNFHSPLQRNLEASLGLGAPLLGKQGMVNFEDLKHMTDIAEQIRAPKYPWAIDRAAAQRGAAHYQKSCASCHDGPESDKRLYAPEEVGTDPLRAKYFNAKSAELQNGLFADVQIKGYTPPADKQVRSTGKYWAADLAGAWARAPYLHNGSVRTMWDLLNAPDRREKSHHRGTRDYDVDHLGYADAGQYVVDTTKPGNSNAGHDYGAKLSDAEKRELIEYLKTK